MKSWTCVGCGGNWYDKDDAEECCEGDIDEKSACDVCEKIIEAENVDLCDDCKKNNMKGDDRIPDNGPSVS